MADSHTTLTQVRRNALEVPSLVLIATSAAGEQRLRLGMQPVVVGSAEDCDLVLIDAGVSRHHCRITLDEQGLRLRDLDSKNGTYLRDVRVIEAPLEPGLHILVGATRLSVGVDGAPRVVPLSLSASFGEAIGGGVAMRALFAQLERAAPTDATVLLQGETGTGKELLARAIHQASPRRAGPFEVLDCAAVSPSLLEGELFGWVAGAFTGAAQAREGVLARAHGGTLFVDELGELPLELQPKLLRALDARQLKPLGGNAWQPFDARIVCASHRDLRAGARAGTFREDLFYRVAMVEARVPPLRERREDVPLLLERFLAAHQPPRSLDDLPPGTLGLLLAHDWPGNVRELWNVAARLAVFADVDEELVELGGEAGSARVQLSAGLPLREARALVVEHFERHFLAAKLRAHAGNVSKAAEALGVSRQFLHRLLDRYGIERDSSW